MTTLHPTNVIAVPVPVDAKDYKIAIDPENHWYFLSYTRMIGDEESGFYGDWEEVDIELPPYTHTFICTSNGCTEEEARKMLGEYAVEYFAKDHFFGLMKERGLNPDENNYALLIKND